MIRKKGYLEGRWLDDWCCVMRGVAAALLEVRLGTRYTGEAAQTDPESLRISVKQSSSLDAAIDRETAILSAMLVVGRARRITEEEIQHPDGTYTFGCEKKSRRRTR